MLGDFNKAAQEQLYVGGYAQHPTAVPDPQIENPASELKYAAGEADIAYKRLAEVIEILAARLEPVLENHPVPVTGAEKAGRAVSSKLAVALLGHASELGGLEARVRGLLSRLAI